MTPLIVWLLIWQYYVGAPDYGIPTADEAACQRLEAGMADALNRLEGVSGYRAQCSLVRDVQAVPPPSIEAGCC